MTTYQLPTLEEYTTGQQKTLGWQILDWGTTFLGQPDYMPGAPRHKGDQWQYSGEQALFVLRFYTVDDNGRFIYRRAVLERAKGWGKSPLLAAICCTELLGPTRFDGWDASGEPVGAPIGSPLIQIAAISDDQANNTLTLVGGMLAEGEAAYAYQGLEILLSKVTTADGGMIQKVTASPRGRQGNRATFVVLDETHLWVPAEKGHELADALRNNLTKMDARSIETTNAHAPGELSVAEDSYGAFLKMQAGETFDKGLLFDTREVYVENIYDYDQAYPALVEVYGDSCQENGGWINLERVWADINDPSWTERSARRFFFNEKTEGKSAWITDSEWNACHDASVSLASGEKFAVGYKGAVRNGAAALVACRLEDSALFLMGLWEKPEHSGPDWEVPWEEIDDRIRKVLGERGCWKLVADPENWQEIIGRIYADHQEKVEELWFTKNRAKATKAVERFETAVKSRRIKWADPNLKRHILACHAYETPQGYLIRKETKGSKRYISAAEAAILALEAAELSIEEGALKKRSKQLHFF